MSVIKKGWSKISRKPHWPEGDRPRHKGYLFVQAIPASTKKAFKDTCWRWPRETMRDAIIRLMRFYVRVNKQIPQPEYDLDPPPED